MAPTPTKCPLCDRVFAKSEHANRHMLRHTGAKPFSCPGCSKSFARKDVLLRHTRAARHITTATTSSTSAPSPLPPPPPKNPSCPSRPPAKTRNFSPTDALLVVSAMHLATITHESDVDVPPRMSPPSDRASVPSTTRAEQGPERSSGPRRGEPKFACGRGVGEGREVGPATALDDGGGWFRAPESSPQAPPRSWGLGDVAMGRRNLVEEHQGRGGWGSVKGYS